MKYRHVAQRSLLVAAVALSSMISGKSFAGEIMVSAAVSLKDALMELAPAFEKDHPGSKLTFNFGASGHLKMQIENGAPADVFVSAAMSDMDALEKKGALLPATRHVVVKNSLVLIKNRAKGPRFAKAEDLAGPEIKRIAIGNPATVPAGRYAKETLENRNLYERIKGKLVFAENVRQVLDYLARGEADAGFVYKTDASMEQKTEIVENIPAGQHQPIQYPAAGLKTGKNPIAGKFFVEFLQSKDAQQVFKKYGFE